MSLIHALLLGLLQGVTEFLPVSSSGHLVLVQDLLPGFSQPGVLFDVLLHVGTMVAVLLYFWKEVIAVTTAPFRTDQAAPLDRRLLMLLAVGSVPTALIGILFRDFFTGLFHNPTVTALMLLVTGTLLFASERFRQSGRKEADLNFGDALVTGIAQGCAIIPGISRSGSTIAALLFKGVHPETAARFSFLLALPAVFGAALFSLKDLGKIPGEELPIYLAGAGVAFFSGMASIHLLLAVIRKRRLFAFALYCWIVGSLFLALPL